MLLSSYFSGGRKMMMSMRFVDYNTIVVSNAYMLLQPVLHYIHVKHGIQKCSVVKWTTLDIRTAQSGSVG